MYVPYYPYPQTPVPYDPRISRGYRPGPIHDPFDPFPDGPWEGRGASLGALPTQLSPRDFSTNNSAALSDGAQYRENAIIGQLRICARGLKTVGDQLQNAQDEKQKKEAAIDGLALASYCAGLLAAEGYTYPSGLVSAKPSGSRGAEAESCREFGKAIDRMVDKYSRGVWEDAGELADKGSSCVRDMREKIGI